MKDLQTRQIFIEMRAQGKTYNEISRQLDVSKQTLISWSKELSTEIANMRAIERDALLKTYELHWQSRMESFSILLSKLRSELKKRDFSEVNTERLVDLMIRVTDLLKDHELVLQHVSTPTFATEKTEWAG